MGQRRTDLTRARRLLLTGLPGSGKTTVIRRVTEAPALHERRLAGFYTEEVRVHGVRTGFRLVTFDGTVRTLADVALLNAPRIGKYGVDVRAVDEIAGSTLAPANKADIYVIDEIGAMECLSRVFVDSVERLLDSPRTIVATIARRGNRWVESIKRRSDVELWTVTRANRDELPSRVLSWLAGSPPSRNGISRS